MEIIKGTNVAGPITPYSTLDKYPTHYAEYGKGGYRTVNTLVDLNSIPADRCEKGMLVYVIAENKAYVCGELDAENNPSWKESDLWVSPETYNADKVSLSGEIANNAYGIGVLSNRINDVQAGVESLGVNIEKQLEEQSNTINGTIAGQIAEQEKKLQEGLAGVQAELGLLQNQVDGEITAWFLRGTPSLDNQPATDWVEVATEDNKDTYEKHIGDTYTNIEEYDPTVTNSTAGQSWRFCNCEHIDETTGETVTGYHWHKIADSDAAKALAEAAKAQSTADGKSTTFLTKPVNGYNIGDLWILQSDEDHVVGKKGDILTANAKSNTYVAEHWSKNVKYTDDTLANEAINAAADAQAKADEAYNDAKQALEDLKDVHADGRVYKSEMKMLLKELADVNQEKTKLKNESDNYDADTNYVAYETAANAAITSLEYYSSTKNLDTTTKEVNGENVIEALDYITIDKEGAPKWNDIVNYYSARQQLLYEITAAAKKYSDSINSIADTAVKNAASAAAAAESAQNTADIAKGQLDAIDDDNLIAVTEFASLESQLDTIVAEYNDIIKNAELYEINTELYETAYTNACEALKYHCHQVYDGVNVARQNADKSITIVNDEYKTYNYGNIAIYYDVRQTILNDTANAAKEFAKQVAEEEAEAKQASLREEFSEIIKNQEESLNKDLATAIETINGGLDNLQKQLDGEVTAWFLKGTPSLDNQPAADWVEVATEDNQDTYEKHIGDTYTNIEAYDSSVEDSTAGQSWRFCDCEYVDETTGETVTGYHWHQIADSDAVKALAEAGKAQSTADGKSTTFITQPSNYKIGDLWILQSDEDHPEGKKGDILTANKSGGEYFSFDWSKNVNYTDDTLANEAKNAAAEAQNKADEAYNDAQQALEDLKDVHADGRVYKSEMKMLLKELEDVRQEKTKLKNESDNYDADTNYSIYETAANAAITSLEYYSNASNLDETTKEVDDETIVEILDYITIDKEGAPKWNDIVDYYSARQQLLYEITAAAKKYSDSINSIASTAVENAQAAAAAAESAQNTADIAKSQLDAIDEDSLIAVTEFASLETQLDTIVAEYSDIIKNAELYEINTESYETAYTNACTALKYHCHQVYDDNESVAEQNADKSITIVNDESKSYNYGNITTYYDVRQNILNSIAFKSKEFAKQVAAEEATAKQAALREEFDKIIENQEASLNKQLADTLETINGGLDNLQKQLDGEVAAWFLKGTPTMENEPVSNWKEEEYEKHIGDTYTNIEEYDPNIANSTAGQSWRFCYCEHVDETTGETVTGYHWHQIADSDAVKALQEAAKAQSTADGKSTTFINKQPSNYRVGDLWILTETATHEDYTVGDILTANETSQEYDKSHWSKEIKYTDDTLAQEAKQGAINAQAEAEAAHADAVNALKELSEVHSDGRVYKSEFKQLSLEKESIIQERNEIVGVDGKGGDASKWNIESIANDYLTSATKAIDALEYFTNSDNLDEKEDGSKLDYITIDNTLWNDITNYYSQRQIILNAIADASKEYSDNIDSKAETAAGAANEAQLAAQAAAAEAEEANSQLNAIGNDSLIGVTEFAVLETQLETINAEYKDIIADAAIYSVSSAEYNLAYNNACAALKYHCGKEYADGEKAPINSDKSITIVNDDTKSYNYGNISAYYDARQTLLNNISKATKEYAESLQFELSPENVNQILSNIKIGGVNIVKKSRNKSFTNWGGTNNITLGVEDEYSTTIINEESQLSMCSKLYDSIIDKNDLTDLEWGGNYVAASVDIFIPSDSVYRENTNPEKVNKLRLEVMFRNKQNDVITNLYHTYSDYKSIKLGKWNRFNFSWKMDYSITDPIVVNDTSYLTNLVYFIVNAGDYYKAGTEFKFRNLQIEFGTTATSWSPAPEDVDAGLEDSYSVAQEAIANANVAQEEANKSIAQLDAMADDSILSAQEKVSVKREWDEIQYEKTQNDNTNNQLWTENGYPNTDQYSNYVEAYNKLSTYIDKLDLENATNIELSTIDSETIDNVEYSGKDLFNKKFKDYYTANTAFLNVVAEQLAYMEVLKVEIGGTNLIVGSESLSITHKMLRDDLEDNANYTISCKEIIKGINSEYVRVAIQIPNGSYKGLVDEWNGSPITFNTEGGYTVIHLYGGNPADTTQVSTFNYIKLEKGTVATDWTPAPEDYANAIAASEDRLGESIAASVAEINGGIESLQKQVDGEVNSWFMKGEPTTSNAPANEWIGTDENGVAFDYRQRHEGDTYTNISSSKDDSTGGQSWRWCNVDDEYGTGWHWHKIADSDAVKALAEAAKAQSVADGKSTTFVTQPSNYQVGDLWILQSDSDHSTGKKGEILTANKSNTTYAASDWSKNVTYTDDTVAKQAVSDAATAQAAATSAQQEAVAAANRLNSWASDSVISPVEKQGIKDEISRINADLQQITKNCTQYSLSNHENFTAFTTAHEDYLKLLNSIINSELELVPIPGEFATAQEAYYSARTDILDIISKTSQNVAENYAKEYSLDAISKMEIGGRNLLKSSNFSGLADGATYDQSTYWLYFADSKYKDQYSLTVSNGYLKLTSTVESWGTATPRMGFYQTKYNIKGQKYILSFDAYADTPVYIKAETGYGDWEAGLRRQITTNKQRYSIEITGENGGSDNYNIFFLRLDENIKTSVYFNNFKLETGTKATDWTPAPEDVEAEILDAKKDAADAAGVAQKAQDQLKLWSDDGVISPLEVQGIKDELASIDADYAEIIVDYEKYEIGEPTDFNGKYEAYRGQLVALSKATADAPVTIPSTFATNQTNYYEARTAAYNSISTGVNTYANKVAQQQAQSAVDNLELGVRNLWAKKYMMDWNDAYAGCATKGTDSYGEYIQIKESNIWQHIANQTTKNDIFGGKIKFEEGKQYCFKVKWRNASSKPTEDGIRFYINYTDGTQVGFSTSNVICDTAEPSIKTLKTDSTKTVAFIGMTFNHSSAQTRIYEIQLVQATKQPNDWMVAPEDIDNEVAIARQEAEEAKQDAVKALSELSEVHSDNRVYMSEFKQLRLELESIIQERNEIVGVDGNGGDASKWDAVLDSGVVKNYFKAATKAIAALSYYSNEDNLDTTQDGDVYCVEFALDTISDDVLELIKDGNNVDDYMDSELGYIGGDFRNNWFVWETGSEMDWDGSTYQLFEESGDSDLYLTDDIWNLYVGCSITDYGYFCTKNSSGNIEEYENPSTIKELKIYTTESSTLDYITIDKVFNEDDEPLWNDITNYYNQRQIILNAIADASKEYSDNIDSKAIAAAAAADDAQDAANASLSQLSDMSNDNILTPQEKGSVADEWACIQKEYTQNSTNKTTIWGSATVAEWTAYNTAYTTLQTYVGTLKLTDRENNTTIVKSDFQTKFANYYSANVAFLNALSKKVAEIEVDNLEIGGGNLLRYTDQSIYSSKFTGYCGTLSLSNGWIKVTQNSGQSTAGVVTSKVSKNDLLVKGKEYVLSFDAYLDSSASVSTLALNYNYLMFNSGSNYIISSNVTITKTPERYSIKFTYNGENTATFGAMVGANKTNCPVYYVKNIKLEQGNKATAWSPAPEDTLAQIEEVRNYTDNLTKTLGDSLQKQIDGVVDSYFMEGEPTTSNAPANEWTTDDLKKRHEGDTYTSISEYPDPSAGKSWRWCPGNTTGDNVGWHWHPIADSDAVKALQEAAAAKDAADGKRRVFTTTPSGPYDVGDLWIKAVGSGMDTLYCKTARTTTGYSESHWASSTVAQNAATAAASAQSTANTAQSTATSAQNAANNAQATATSAGTAASKAQAAANTANTNATNALNTAKNANAAAAEAKKMAQDEATATQHLKTVLAKGTTDISGGLVLTNVLALRDTDNTTVTAGMSGVNSDNILLWGGGTYQEAYVAANNDYKIDSAGNLITTLLKKDGTGKIGVFEIDDSEAIVNDEAGYERVVIANDELANHLNEINNCSLEYSEVDLRFMDFSSDIVIDFIREMEGNYNFDNPNYNKLSYVQGGVRLSLLNLKLQSASSNSTEYIDFYIRTPNGNDILFGTAELTKYSNVEFKASYKELRFNIDVTEYNFDKSRHTDFRIRVKSRKLGKISFELGTTIRTVCTTAKTIITPDALSIRADGGSMFEITSNFGKISAKIVGLPAEVPKYDHFLYISSPRATDSAVRDLKNVMNYLYDTGGNLNTFFVQFIDLLTYIKTLTENLSSYCKTVHTACSGAIGTSNAATLLNSYNTLKSSIDNLQKCINSGTYTSPADGIVRNGLLTSRTTSTPDVDEFKLPLSDLTENTILDQGRYKAESLVRLRNSASTARDNLNNTNILCIK